MTIQQFTNSHDSHAHSLTILNLLQEYDTFMESVNTVLDIGCGKDALDLIWWATRTTRDEEEPEPLNIKSTGVDMFPSLSPVSSYENVEYIRHDFEKPFADGSRYDVIWAHDSFQYALNPLKTLRIWNNILDASGMISITVPSFTNFEFNKVAFENPNFCYFNHTIPSLMYMMAVNGFDCSDAMFHKKVGDPWISVIAYKSSVAPMDPRKTKWYDLVDTGLLPDTAIKSINKYGLVRQQDLTTQWLDKNLYWMGHE